nr:hypothetical protein [uncultured Peptostreptococcus sp.]
MTREDTINNLYALYGQYGINLDSIEHTVSLMADNHEYKDIYRQLKYLYEQKLGVHMFISVKDVARLLNEPVHTVLHEIKELDIPIMYAEIKQGNNK